MGAPMAAKTRRGRSCQHRGLSRCIGWVENKLGRTTVTLILTCLTDDCVYQVSDRRLTSFDPPRAPIDDESNKATFVNGRAIFGYTGISKINGENTDLWLTRIAASTSSSDMGVIARTIRDEATSAFRRMNFASRYKRHAFQGAGWFSSPDDHGLRPGTVTVHNAIESGTIKWLPYARPSFELSVDLPRIGRAQFYLYSVGLTLGQSEMSAIYRLVRKCVHRRQRRQESTLWALILSVRWLHDRYEPNSPIGPNVVAVSLPRVAAERVAETGEFLAVSSGPAATHATFLDVNASGRIETFGPNVAHAGSMMSGFAVRPIAANHGAA